MKTYAEIKPEFGFEYTFTCIDESTKRIVMRCFCNFEGLKQMLEVHTHMQRSGRYKFMCKVTERRYAEYAVYSDDGQNYSVYASYVGNPESARTLLDELKEEMEIVELVADERL